jgi:hypothetical protein
MDSTIFPAFLRACEHLTADNQAMIDWAVDTEFRMSVPHRDVLRALRLLRYSPEELDWGQLPRARGPIGRTR